MAVGQERTRCFIILARYGVQLKPESCSDRRTRGAEKIVHY